MKKIVLILLVLASFRLFSQDLNNLPIAKEVWSQPVKVDSFSYPIRWGIASSFTQSMDTIYLESTDGDLYTSILKNTTWASPIKINGFINDGTPVRNPTISKDGKRLYFSSWRGGYGGWDLYCSTWNTTTNDWGQAENLGSQINSYDGEYYAYELSPDTLYCINDRWASMGVCIYIKNKTSGEWRIIDSSNYYHPFGAGGIRGLCITADRRKAYFSRYISLSTDSLQSELHVTYWDTIKNRWGDSYRLNINSKAYEIKVTENYSVWSGGWDEYPWISPDGKTLYFTSNRDRARIDTNTAAADIYESHLIVNDKGDSVTSVSIINEPVGKIYKLKLLPNYPNPFNPETNITFELPQSGNINLIVYDILGKEIEKLINDKYYTKGVHNLLWNIKNGSEISSGVYFLRLSSGNSITTNKIIYLK